VPRHPALEPAGLRYLDEALASIPVKLDRDLVLNLAFGLDLDDFADAATFAFAVESYGDGEVDVDRPVISISDNSQSLSTIAAQQLNQLQSLRRALGLDAALDRGLPDEEREVAIAFTLNAAVDLALYLDRHGTFDPQRTRGPKQILSGLLERASELLLNSAVSRYVKGLQDWAAKMDLHQRRNRILAVVFYIPLARSYTLLLMLSLRRAEAEKRRLKLERDYYLSFLAQVAHAAMVIVQSRRTGKLPAFGGIRMVRQRTTIQPEDSLGAADVASSASRADHAIL
jgi:hypothetical protein